MKREMVASSIIMTLCALRSPGQIAHEKSEVVPIYHVTVVERTLKAINYQYRAGPTSVDFRGTVLMPKVKGKAEVESKRGRIEVDAKLENLEEPQLFGREYLTYVLWAISPEGRPHNIGEMIVDGSNKAKLRVTTDLQAFGLIVTAEPYSAVRRPSDVVVAENQVRADTIGKIEQVQAKYELMPRGNYTWQRSGSLQSEAANAPKVSMDQYEATLELYQAQNAIGIAQAARAEQYAPNTFLKAQELLNEARRLDNIRGSTRLVVQSARESAQTAEDARAIAERREQEQKLANAQLEASQAQQAKIQTEAEALRARAQADTAREQADAERKTRERAEADAALANRTQADARLSRRRDDAARRSEFRMRLLEKLNVVIGTRDTPRGLVATLPDTGFSGPLLHGAVSEQVARIATIIKAYPGLQIAVEGHTDRQATEGLSWKRAEAVRNSLVGNGIGSGIVSARGLGNTHPLVFNGNATGREENRRVEIVISGDPIGKLPSWDRSYSLTLR